MEYRINSKDVNDWSKEYEGEKFHALLCDAPYHLTTITKRFGKDGAAPAKFGTDGLFQRTSRGFMGQEWDGGDVAFRPETWAGLGEHLYPGAFGMTFGGARTAHKIAMAIDEAGFIIHPMIGWINGQGFPKATRVKGHPEFDGHRYGLQTLKPALEPIIVFQKPYEDRPLDGILSTGTGTINVDGGRIQLKDEAGYTINRFTAGARPFGDAVGEEYNSVEETKGRWPANFLLDDTVEFPESKFFFNVETKLDEADPYIYEKKVSVKEREAGLEDLETKSFGMSGGAQSHLEEGYDNGQGIGLNRVQSRKNNHPTLKSIALTKYLATLLLPPVEYAPRRLLVPFSGVASEMIGGLLSGWEYVEGIEFTAEYVSIAHKRIEHWVKEA